MSDSSRNKPSKPYPGFPLFAHASGRWAKKIRGQLKYFGWWNKPDGPNWQAALALYQKQRDYLHAGLEPQEDTGAKLGDVLNHYLTMQGDKLRLGEIGHRSYRDYERTCDLLVAHFGRDKRVDLLTPHELDAYRLKLSKTRNVRTLGNEVNRARMALNHAHEARFIPEPIKYSKQFTQPTRAVLRKHRAKQGKKMFTPRDVRELVLNASPALAAMILLGVNCGFGPTDCATLQFRHLHLDTGWHDYHRPKTAIERSCPLWPETIEALHDYLEKRPAPKSKDDSELVFITRYGHRYIRENDPATISKEFSKLTKSLGITGTFYWLRHVFETVAGGSKDQVAIDHVMGHSKPTMAGEYREEVQPERLQAVVDVVREWVDFEASIAESRSLDEDRSA